MRKLFILFTFLSVSLMGFAEAYCEKVVTTTIDYTSLDVKVTVKKQSATTVRVILDNEHITGIRAGGTFQAWGNGIWENQDDAVANFAQGWAQSGTAWSKDFVFSTYPTTGNFRIYILMDHDAGAPPVAGFTLDGIDIDNDCSAPVKTDPALSLNSTAETLDATAPAGTFQIVATQSGDGAVSYESSNPGIASVDNTGLVTAVGRGTATITVNTAETATYAQASKTLTVTVTGPINWAAYDWVEGSNSKYKIVTAAGQSVVNVQSKSGHDAIYTTFASEIQQCSLGAGNYESDGAGMWIYLSSIIRDETEVAVLLNGAHTRVFTIYYADGNASYDPAPVEEPGVNFALISNGGVPTATSDDAGRAVDNNNGTRWESASSDPQEWIVDLGKRRIFNAVQIRWEGAYGKTFTIDVSNDKSTWTNVSTVTDQELAGFPYEQQLEFAKTTARYVRFHGTARGTGYGYSFWEFRVMLLDAEVLTSIDLTAAASFAQVGGAGVALTAQPKNQYGINMSAAVSYEITPTGAGHMSGNTYIPDQVGSASIRAYNGTVYSNAVTVFGYEGSNLALSTNRLTDNKVVAQVAVDPDGSANDAYYAVDDSDSEWQGSTTNGTDGDETSRTFDAWFVVDLGALYDIDLITIKFEGACSELYHIDFSEDNSVWYTGYNYVGSAGINGHTDVLTSFTDNTKVKYVRFWSTRAATEWGMKIHRFEVYGRDWVDPGDTQAPVMTSASLDSKTWNSAIINVAATDEDGTIAKFRVVNASPAIDAEYVPADGKITLTGLTAETAYNLTITAIDAANHESANNKTVAFTTNAHILAPATAAPVPTWPATQVKSLYSDTYAFAPTGLNSYNEDWWKAPNMTEGNIGGNHYLDYDLYRDGMIGVQFAETSMATMEKIHIDIWASAAGTVTFRPIIVDDGALNDNRKTLTLLAGQWNSFDIDMSDFGAHNWTKVFQYSIENYNAGGLVGEHIAVDNVFFYRETPYVDAEAPKSVSATLLGTTYVSASIQVSATDNSGAVLYDVKNGGTLLASGGGESGATVTVNVPNLTPGTAYNLSVIAKDDAGNEADPVAVTVNTLALPSPAPIPTHASAAVKSLYADTYTPAADLTTTNQDWWYAPTNTEITFPGNNKALYYYNIHEGSSVLGWAFGVLDASNYQYLHLSIYPLNAGTIEVYPVIAPEGEFHRTQALTANQWNEIVFDYTDKTFAPMTQLGFIIPQAFGSCIIDNVYFFKNPDLARDAAHGDDWMAPGQLGTICIPNGAVAEGGDIYQLVGKNSEGKIVFSTVDNNQMEPGKPYLFEATSNALKFYYTDATPAAAPDNSGAMKGTFVDIPAMTELDNVYYFADHALWSCVDLSSLHVPANRAYVKLDEVDNIGSSSPAPGRRYITMGVNGKDAATGFDQLNASEAPMKMIIDGQLFILRGEKLYDATGRLVK